LKLRILYVGCEVLIAVVMKRFHLLGYDAVLFGEVNCHSEEHILPHLWGQRISQARNQHEEDSEKSQNSAVGCSIVRDMLKTGL
jgi:hypothetical protein